MKIYVICIGSISLSAKTQGCNIGIALEVKSCFGKPLKGRIVKAQLVKIVFYPDLNHPLCSLCRCLGCQDYACNNFKMHM